MAVEAEARVEAAVTVVVTVAAEAEAEVVDLVEAVMVAVAIVIVWVIRGHNRRKADERAMQEFKRWMTNRPEHPHIREVTPRHRGLPRVPEVPPSYPRHSARDG